MNRFRLTAVEQFDVPTFFNAISTKVDWGLFFTDVWYDNLSYTEYTFPQISQAPNGQRGDLSRFYSLAASGGLPAFTYLEPKWGYGKGTILHQGTDDHPPTHLFPGEQFLLRVYRALRDGQKWNETLLIVTFDEHGGTYDHVGPPWGAINPDGKIGKDGFKFNLFGARVPTLLISPYIQAGTVFRAPTTSQYPFDHTSFIKTILQWAGVDPTSVNFGKRMPAAPTFEEVFSSTIVNQETLDSDVGAPSFDETTAYEVPPGAEKPLNDLFDGMPFASVRAIIHESETLNDVRDGIARFKADPAAFEKSLE